MTERTLSRSWITFILLTVAVVLRAFGLDGTLWLDEAGSIAQASAPNFWEAASLDVHPPLYYAILRLQLELTHSAAWLRLFSVGCGLGLLLVVLRLLRESPVAMIVAGAVVAGLPEFIFHSQQLRPYALLFLLLALALSLAVRGFSGSGLSSREKILLALVLVAASATHLVTVFFLTVLAPLLGSPVRQKGFRALAGALAPLVPPALFLLWLKFRFVSQPADLSGGWWIPEANVHLVFSSVRSAIGWDEVYWFSDACARRWAGAGMVVQTIAVVSAVFTAWTAWGRRHTPPIAWVLLAGSLLHLGALVLYSFLFEPVVMARTVLPALLPLAVSMGFGIAAHPVPWRRTVASVCVVVYLFFSASPVVRRSFSPLAGLRGLAAATQTEYRPGDVVVLFRAMDFGLSPYWPGFSGSNPIFFDQAKPVAPQLAGVRQRLQGMNARSRVLVVYRHDFYLEKFRPSVDSVIDELAAHGRVARVRWHENDLTLLLAEPAGNP